MEAVGGRPGDGDEIEAVLRHFFTASREPAAGIVTGKLHDIALITDPQLPKIPWGLTQGEGRVRRVGAATVSGDEASADFSAVFAPTNAIAGTVEPKQLTRFEGPMRLHRQDGRWKLVDYYVDGQLATAGIHRLNGEATASGITVRLRVSVGRPRGSSLGMTVRNEREHPIWFVEGATFRYPARVHFGRAVRWVTVAPGETEPVTLQWEGPFRPFASTIRLLLPVFDLGIRKWKRVRVKAVASEEGAG